MKYHQLTQKQRYQIENYLALKISITEIANKIGMHRSSVYREIKRNSLKDHWGDISYEALSAEGQTEARRRESGTSRRKIKGELLKKIILGLDLHFSPEQIAGRLKLESGMCKTSSSSIYRHIWRDSGDWWEGLGLYRKLRRFVRKRSRKRCTRPEPKGIKSPRLSVRERPMAAENRTEIGHIERDLMEGKRGGVAINVLVDRKSRYTALGSVKRNGESIQCSTLEIKNRKLLKKKIKTITNDNGYEFIFSRFVNAKKKLGLEVYFTDPGSPWQRGTVENTIGLIRQFLPKKTNLNKIKKSEIRKIEKILNGRPRKILNFYTPTEILTSKSGKRPKIQQKIFI